MNTMKHCVSTDIVSLSSVEKLCPFPSTDLQEVNILLRRFVELGDMRETSVWVTLSLPLLALSISECEPEIF